MPCPNLLRPWRLWCVNTYPRPAVVPRPPVAQSQPKWPSDTCRAPGAANLFQRARGRGSEGAAEFSSTDARRTRPAGPAFGVQSQPSKRSDGATAAAALSTGGRAPRAAAAQASRGTHRPSRGALDGGARRARCPAPGRSMPCRRRRAKSACPRHWAAPRVPAWATLARRGVMGGATPCQGARRAPGRDCLRVRPTSRFTILAMVLRQALPRANCLNSPNQPLRSVHLHPALRSA